MPVDAAGNVAWTVDPSLYDEWRDDPGPRSLRPSIPAPVTRGPYLRVFVPLVPDWVAAWVEDHCPELEPLEAHRRDGEAGRRERPEIPDDRVAAARECLLAGHSIEVDGRPVRDELLFGTHPESGAMGLIGYLDLRGRERGRHEISIRRLAAGEERPERRYRIPFWR